MEKKMKKIVIGLLVLVMSFLMGACGDVPEKEADTGINPERALIQDHSGEDRQQTAEESQNSENAGSAAESTQSVGKKAEMASARYWILPGEQGNQLFYAVQIHNPNESLAIRFPAIHITAKAADGSVLKAETQKLHSIAANDTITYGDSISYEGAVADTVEMYVTNSDEYLLQEGSGVIRQEDLSIVNAFENDGASGITYTGEVTNHSTADLSMACVTVVFRKDGDLVGGATAFIENLKSGDTRPFEISPSMVPEHDSYEIHALQWT